MRAIILAAGLGVRMRPLTFKTPKALVEISANPLLQILLQKLTNAGFDQIAVNSHYKAGIVYDFIRNYRLHTSADIFYSHEQEILNTGGGIKKMLTFFSGDDPILVHNVDILSAIRFSVLIAYHLDKQADCTMAVNTCDSDRLLCFDQTMNFKGRCSEASSAKDKKYNFCGVQVIQPSIFHDISEKSFYSIDAYIGAANHGKKVVGYDIGKAYWRDVGRIEDIEKADKDIMDGTFSIE